MSKFISNPFYVLTGVTIDIEATSAIEVTVNWVSDLPVYTGVSGITDITLTTGTPDAATVNVAPAYSVPADAAIDPTPLSAVNTVHLYNDFDGAPDIRTASDSVAVASANFGNYISMGPGDLVFTLGVDSSTDTSLIGLSGGVAFPLVPQANAYGTVTITYTYSIIPEPASFSLLGLSGLVAFRRRRR